MSRHRNSIGGQFAPLLIEMLESPAWRVLSLSAYRVLYRIEIELRRHGGNDNGKLPVTYDDFHKYGIHRHSIAPAIRECAALGFLEITQQGRAGNAEFRKPSHYRLTYHSSAPSKPDHGPGTEKPTWKGKRGEYRSSWEPTHEWRKITTIEEAVRLAKDARSKPPKRSDRKTKTSDGKCHVSVTETVTENRSNHSAESVTTAHGKNHHYFRYLGRGRPGREPEQVVVPDRSTRPVPAASGLPRQRPEPRKMS